MKTKPIFSTLLATMLMLSLSILGFSCEENDIDASGSANLKVVNAAPSAGAQSFHLVDKDIISGGLDFTEASDFIATVAGTRLSAQFRSEGSLSTTVDGELYLLKNRHYTVFLRGDGDDLRIKQYEDDLSYPPAAMARIKFLHFASGAPSDLVINGAGGDKLIGTLSRDTESKYINVTAGTLALEIEELALKKSVAHLTIPDLKGGKIYTVYLTGSSAANITAHTVEY